MSVPKHDVGKHYRQQCCLCLTAKSFAGTSQVGIKCSEPQQSLLDVLLGGLVIPFALYFKTQDKTKATCCPPEINHLVKVQNLYEKMPEGFSRMSFRWVGLSLPTGERSTFLSSLQQVLTAAVQPRGLAAHRMHWALAPDP